MEPQKGSHEGEATLAALAKTLRIDETILKSALEEAYDHVLALHSPLTALQLALARRGYRFDSQLFDSIMYAFSQGFSSILNSADSKSENILMRALSRTHDIGLHQFTSDAILMPPPPPPANLMHSELSIDATPTNTHINAKHPGTYHNDKPMNYPSFSTSALHHIDNIPQHEWTAPSNRTTSYVPAASIQGFTTSSNILQPSSYFAPQVPFSHAQNLASATITPTHHHHHHHQHQLVPYHPSTWTDYATVASEDSAHLDSPYYDASSEYDLETEFPFL